ncbi:hypothetical protein ACTID9_08080 [Brevibacillus fluminis]|uniref:hypothetical protein n=1 Tax=Brevibacillus fluminis TaxID=511487 RepID=UPI003F8CD510
MRLQMDPIAARIAVVEFGIHYEKLYIDWCNRLLARMGDASSLIRWRSGSEDMYCRASCGNVF